MAKKRYHGGAKPMTSRPRNLTKQEKIDALLKNGITPKDLEKAWNDGVAAANRAMGDFYIRTCYAAAALAAHREFGFGAGRVRKLLAAIDRIVLEELTTDEAINKVFAEIGLRLDFNDPFERVTEV